jgi:hypothetical protein
LAVGHSQAPGQPGAAKLGVRRHSPPGFSLIRDGNFANKTIKVAVPLYAAAMPKALLRQTSSRFVRSTESSDTAIRGVISTRARFIHGHAYDARCRASSFIGASSRTSGPFPGIEPICRRPATSPGALRFARYLALLRLLPNESPARSDRGATPRSPPSTTQNAPAAEGLATDATAVALLTLALNRNVAPAALALARQAGFGQNAACRSTENLLSGQLKAILPRSAS